MKLPSGARLAENLTLATTREEARTEMVFHLRHRGLPRRPRARIRARSAATKAHSSTKVVPAMM